MTPSNPVPVVVMLGGGVESTKLVRDFLEAGTTVIPLHISCGLIWDACESEHIHRFLKAQNSPLLQPLIEFSVSLAGFLGNHWAVTGKQVPAADDPSSR